MDTAFAQGMGFLGAVLMMSFALGAEKGMSPEPYDVIWDSPGQSARDSMPLGNGDISLNVWVEPGGDLLFYIGKTDAWGDNVRLLKVGRIRVHLEPLPEMGEGSFEQRLRLEDGTVEVRYGEHGEETYVRVWVDAQAPVVNVTVEGKTPSVATASIELWREEPYELPSIEVSDVLLNRSKESGQVATTIVEPDVLIQNLDGCVGWFHHNTKSVGPELSMEQQGLEGFPLKDPILHRTFGAVITSPLGVRENDSTLRSSESPSHRFSVYVATRHPSTPEEWLKDINQIIEKNEKSSFRERKKRHEDWWKAFWDRSWIQAACSDKDDAFTVSRGYALQRFINACAGRGTYPIKFNGSIFTMPWPDKPGDADYRRWGPGYWWQNTRLPYLSMCTSGDFDLLQPFFRMYTEEVLPLCVYRTRHYMGHGGAYFPECIYFWGAVFTDTYGWTPFEERGEDKLQTSGWHKWEWVCGPELVHMMLDYYDHTLDKTFLAEKVLPAAEQVLTFFEEHYEVDEKGKLFMHPSQSLETWWDCTNPMPEVAGLRAVTGRLLALEAGLASDEEKTFWKALWEKLPDLPTREVDGVQMLAPAERFENKRNCENPELYAVFPFRNVALGRGDMDLAKEALKHRWDQGNAGWRQDDVFMAYLGLTAEAKRFLVERAQKSDPNCRFPAFWGPNYDWTPDQDHGGILLKAFQAMALQSDPHWVTGEGGKIYLLPAWPKEWDVRFKLHAPERTVVECVYRDGKIDKLQVEPEARRSDVVLPAWLK